MNVLARLFIIAIKTTLVYGLFLVGAYWGASKYLDSLWLGDIEPYRLVITFEPFVRPADALQILSYNGLSGDIRKAMQTDFSGRELTVTANVPQYSLKS